MYLLEHFVAARLKFETNLERRDCLLKAQASEVSWQRKYLPRGQKPRRDGPIQGPRPSIFLGHCLKDPLLAWIFQPSGAEAVVDFALERSELANNITANKKWMHLVGCGIRHQEALEQQLQVIAEQDGTCTATELGTATPAADSARQQTPFAVVARRGFYCLQAACFMAKSSLAM